MVILLLPIFALNAGIPVNHTLDNGDIASVIDDSRIVIATPTDPTHPTIKQVSIFYCMLVSEAIQRLHDMQTDLQTDPNVFMQKQIAYPLTWNHANKHYKFLTATQLAPKFKQVFNSHIHTVIFKQDPYRLFANSQGIMLNDGDVWFCDKGIFVVNS